MRITIFMAVILLLASCGPAAKLKRIKRQIRNGARADTVTVIKWGSVSIQGLRDSLHVPYSIKVDRTRLIDLCADLNAEPESPRIITRFREAVTQPLQIDSTYNITVGTADGDFRISLALHARSDATGLTQWFDVPAVDVPVRETQTNVTVTRKIPWWIWAIIALEGLCIVALIFRR